MSLRICLSRQQAQLQRQLDEASRRLEAEDFAKLSSRETILSELMQAALPMVYMGLLRMCLSAFACGEDAAAPSGASYLRIMPSMECFGAEHTPYVALGLLALVMLYPYATLSYPLFQVVSMSRIKFNHAFLFAVIQIQTVLMIVGTMVPTRTYFVLGLTLAVDVYLVIMFVGVPPRLHCIFPAALRRPPCTVGSVNRGAACAFAFSAWLNICSALTVLMGRDAVAVALLFTFVAALSEYAVYRLTRSVFPQRDKLIRLGQHFCTYFRGVSTKDQERAKSAFTLVDDYRRRVWRPALACKLGDVLTDVFFATKVWQLEGSSWATSSFSARLVYAVLVIERGSDGC